DGGDGVVVGLPVDDMVVDETRGAPSDGRNPVVVAARSIVAVDAVAREIGFLVRIPQQLDALVLGDGIEAAGCRGSLVVRLVVTPVTMIASREGDRRKQEQREPKSPSPLPARISHPVGGKPAVVRPRDRFSPHRVLSFSALTRSLANYAFRVPRPSALGMREARTAAASTLRTVEAQARERNRGRDRRLPRLRSRRESTVSRRAPERGCGIVTWRRDHEV